MKSLAEAIDSKYLEALGTIRLWESKLLSESTLERLKEARNRETLISLLNEGEAGSLSPLTQDSLDSHFVDKLKFLKKIVPELVEPFALRYDFSFFKGSIRQKVKDKPFVDEGKSYAVVIPPEKLLRDVEEGKLTSFQSLLEEEEFHLLRKAIERFLKNAIEELEFEALVDKVYLSYYLKKSKKTGPIAELFARIEVDRFNLSLIARFPSKFDRDFLIEDSPVKFPQDREVDLKTVASSLLSSEVYSSGFCSSLEKIQDTVSLHDLFEEEIYNWAKMFSLGNFGEANILSYVYKKRYETIKIKRALAQIL